MTKLAERLTDIKVKTVKSKETPFKLAAGRGLHLLVKTDGSKHWQFRFRFNGKENTITGLHAPAVVVGSTKKLKIGAKVYAIGAPNGFELTLLMRAPNHPYYAIKTTHPI